MLKLDSFQSELLTELRATAIKNAAVQRATKVRRRWLAAGGAAVAASAAVGLVVAGTPNATNTPQPPFQTVAFVMDETPNGAISITAHALLSAADLQRLQAQLRDHGLNVTVGSAYNNALAGLGPTADPAKTFLPETADEVRWNCAPPSPNWLAKFDATPGNYTMTIPAQSALRTGKPFYLYVTASDPMSGYYRVVLPRPGRTALCDGGDMAPLQSREHVFNMIVGKVAHGRR